MQPTGRTVSFDRGWIVKHLQDAEAKEEVRLKVEIARASKYFPTRRDIHRSWRKNTSLVGGDDFIANAAPSNAAAEE
jgi:hypothetical protein